MALDFEVDESNSFQKHFPGCQCDACHFHMQQANIVKLAKLVWPSDDSDKSGLNLKCLYQKDKKFANSIRCFSALSFLPETEVIPAFEALEEKFEGEVPDSFIGYFEKNYIGKPFGRKKVRKEPRLPITFWNCYELQ